jgi:glycerol uptake facilitator protein
MKTYSIICFGEFFGTFLLVFFGTSTVAVSVLFNASSGLVQVAVVWGVAAAFFRFVVSPLMAAKGGEDFCGCEPSSETRQQSV